MNLWRLSEATDFAWLPNQLEQVPAYIIDEWMQYLKIRADERRKEEQRRKNNKRH